MTERAIIEALMAVFLLIGAPCNAAGSYFWWRIYRKTGRAIDAVMAVGAMTLAVVFLVMAVLVGVM